MKTQKLNTENMEVFFAISQEAIRNRLSDQRGKDVKKTARLFL
jgi:hypothetical protein